MPTYGVDGVGWVLHELAREHAWEGVGDLSLKSFAGGAARYRSDGDFLVDDSCFLALNAGQPYRVEIEQLEPIESLCVFFAPGFVEGVAWAQAKPAAALLDDPARQGQGFALVPRTHAADCGPGPALSALRAAIDRRHAAPGWLEEQLHSLAAELVLLNGVVRSEIAALPARRAATRAELYRRLHLARDFIHAHAERPITIGEIAAAAALSPNHLLRSFRALFGQTPHQYLIELRLRRACALLRSGDLPVSAICLEVGFESLGSFSSLFRRATGRSPQRYRREAHFGDF